MPNTLPAALAFSLVLYAIWKYIQDRQVCAYCNGWYQHKRDCPFKR